MDIIASGVCRFKTGICFEQVYLRSVAFMDMYSNNAILILIWKWNKNRKVRGYLTSNDMMNKFDVGHANSWAQKWVVWGHCSKLWLLQLLPVNSPHKGRWPGALMFSLICAWINVWVNTPEVGDLRRHRAHYDIIIMMQCTPVMRWLTLSKYS